MQRKIRLAVIATLIASGAGCQSWFKKTEPPLTAPVAAVQVIHFAGTALSGPQVGTVNAAAAWGVKATVTAIESTAPVGFERIGSAARLVIGPDTGSVVSPSARLIYSAQLRSLAKDESLDAALGTATTHAAMGEQAAAIIPGATASFEIRLPDDAPTTAAFSRRAVRVQLYRAATSDAYDIAIASDDLAAATDSSLATASRELIVIGRKLVDGADHVALVIPMAFPKSSAKAIVFDLQVSDVAPDADAVLAGAKSQIDASSAAVAALRTAPVEQPNDLAVERSLSSLTSAGTSPRAALLFLSERTAAQLTHAVALVADDRLLQLIAGDMQSRLGQMTARDHRSIAWLLDRATIGSLATVKEEDASRVLPPIQGALSIYAGEAGRQLDVLRSLAGEATSSEDLYNRITAENLILLEESSPGLRVRAYDWLRAAGKAPEGFDPLASPQDRRAALERARTPATQPTTATTP